MVLISIFNKEPAQNDNFAEEYQLQYDQLIKQHTIINYILNISTGYNLSSWKTFLMLILMK